MADNTILFSFPSMAATYGVIYGPFAWADDRAKDEARTAISTWVADRAVSASDRSYGSVFYELLFGPKWLSIRSCLSIALLSIGCYIIVGLSHGSEFSLTEKSYIIDIMRLFILCFCGVVLGRYVASLVSGRFGPRSVPIYFVLDFIVKFVLGFVLIQIDDMFLTPPPAKDDPLGMLIDLLRIVDIGSAYVLFCFILLFSLSAFYITFLLRNVINFEKQPIKTIGSIYAALCALGYPLVVWLYRLGTFQNPG